MANTDLEVKNHHAQFEPPDLTPIVAVETTPTGWRGLTMDGTILNVESLKIPYGDRVAIIRNGEHIGYRKMPDQASPGLINRYLRCSDISRRAIKSGYLQNALLSVETAMSFAPTLSAYYNRGMILLEMNRWQEGFAEYAHAMEYPGSGFTRSQYRGCIEYGLQRWRGEDISGKRLLLIHDHGFGDSIMMLRYVPMLKAMGAHVVLWLPPELERLASQCAPVVTTPVGADYFCSLLFLLQVLQQTPETIPLQPYLKVDPALSSKWHWYKGPVTGVAWQAHNTGEGDYPRNIELTRIVKTLPDARLVSVQQHGGFDARINGVEQPLFEDFADCAALMLCCDEIITIDTAAVHLAGAICHPNVKLLLSHWASWRWLSPLYLNVKICRQDKADDWDSALAKLQDAA
jgi:hypothetical protein